MDLARKTGLIAGLGAGAVFIMRAGPSLSWQDSGELISAAFQLGVPHPTGFPTVMMGAKLLALVPLGEVALRVALLSALTAAAAVGLLAAVAVELVRDEGSPRWLGAAAGALAAAGLAFAPTMMQNALTLEAYAPSLALLVGMIGLALGDGGRPTPRRVMLIALCYGLGATTHVIVRFHGLLPLIAALWWCRDISRRRLLLLAVAAVGLGALAMAYVPLASLRDAPLDWGDPETPARLWDHLSGARIRRAFEGRMLNPAWVPIDAPVLGRLVLGDLGLPLLALALAGLIGLLRRHRRAAALIAAVAAGDAAYSVLLNPMGLVDRQVGFPLLAMLALLGGAGLATLARVRPARGWRVLAAGVATVAAAFPLAAGLTWAGPGYGPASIMAEALALPPRAAVLCSSDSLCGGLLWAQYVEGDRPDVVALPRQHLWDEATLRGRFSRHAPELLGRAPGGLALGRAVALLERGREVFWERGGDEGELGRVRPDSELTLDAPVPLFRLDGEPRPVDRRLGELEAAVDRWYGRPVPPDESGRRYVAGLLSSLAMAAADRDDLRAAAELLERSYELSPRAEPLLNLSALAVRAGDPEGAWRWIEAALEHEPGSVRGLVMAGKLWLSRERDERARAYYQRARRLCPGRCGGPLEGLGILAARAGDYERARELLTEALRREPWLDDARANLELLERVAGDGG